jgi:hypothetical protein
MTGRRQSWRSMWSRSQFASRGLRPRGRRTTGPSCFPRSIRKDGVSTAGMPSNGPRYLHPSPRAPFGLAHDNPVRMEIRVGGHTGDVEASEDTLTGIAAHIGGTSPGRRVARQGECSSYRLAGFPSPSLGRWPDPLSRSRQAIRGSSAIEAKGPGIMSLRSPE